MAEAVHAAHLAHGHAELRWHVSETYLRGHVDAHPVPEAEGPTHLFGVPVVIDESERCDLERWDESRGEWMLIWRFWRTQEKG
jgi:hypothetical protein